FLVQAPVRRDSPQCEPRTVSKMPPRPWSTSADSRRLTSTLHDQEIRRKSNPYTRKSRDIANLWLITHQSSIPGASTGKEGRSAPASPVVSPASKHRTASQSGAQSNVV